MPLLLEQLEVAGCIVSIDAMGCLPKIAKQIKEHDGEYVLALKANQGTLYQDVVDVFADALIPRELTWCMTTNTISRSGNQRLTSQIRVCAA